MKKLRLIEFFAGYGSQHKALDYLGIDVESWKTCEWAVKSIQALKDLHFSSDNNDYSKDLSKEQLIDYLSKKGISADYNSPMSLEQIKRLGEEKLRQVYNNIQATHNLVNIQQVHAEDLEIVDVDKYDYLLTYSFPCFTRDSLVLTSNGYKKIADIEKGDYVLSHDNTYHKVVNTFDNGTHGIYSINAMGIDEIKTTFNHRFYVREKYRKGHKGIRCFREPVWKELKDITNNDYLGIAINQENNLVISKSLPTKQKDFWWVIGRYLGDGWIRQQGGIIICCAKDETCDIIPKLDNLGWNYNIVEETTVNKIHIAKKALSDYVEQFGKGAGNKHLTQDIIDLPTDFLKAFLDGYMSADGCYTMGVYKATSISRELIYGIAHCVAKVYHTPYRIYRVNPPKTKVIEGRIVNQNKWYQLVFKLEKKKQDKAFYENGYIWYPINSIDYIGQDNVYDIEVEDSHSFTVQNTIVHNCQDLSLAGKGKGMARDGGTRSGMLWEVERILKELCSQGGNLPNILLMENVPQVHGTANKDHFKEWCDFLKSIGYTNSWADLNAKNFGIPQNRERTFMVSVLNGNGNLFSFPQPFKLNFRLKDLLEKAVDEKYYLSDKIASKLAFNPKTTPKEIMGVDLCSSKSETRDVASTIKSRYDCGYEKFSPGPTGVIEPNLNIVAKSSDGNNFNSIYSDNGISPTLLARDYKDPVRIQESTDRLMELTSNVAQANRVYDPNGVSCTLSSNGGGLGAKTGLYITSDKPLATTEYLGTYEYTKSDKFIGSGNRFIENNDISSAVLTTHANGVVLNEPRICTSRGRNPENPNSIKGEGHLEQRIELGPDGLSNTLTTVQKDNYVVEPQVLTPKRTEYGKQIRKYYESGLISESRHNMTSMEPRTDGVSNTLTTVQKDNYVVEPKLVGGIGEMKSNGGTQWYQQDRVYDADSIAISVTTAFNPNYKIEDKDSAKEDNLKKQFCNKLIETGAVQEGDVIRHSYTNSRFDSFHIENKNEHDCCATIPTRADTLGVVVDDKTSVKVCPTLDTRCDCLGVVVNDKSDSPEFANKRLQDLVDKTNFGDETLALDCYNQTTHDDCMQAITTRVDKSNKDMVYNNYRIRKLTPKECWRLMGIKDGDFAKVAKNQSNASLYHLAGDSIVTTCLMAILGKMFNVDYRAKIKELLKALNPNFDFDSIEPETVYEKASLFDGLFD